MALFGNDYKYETFLFVKVSFVGILGCVYYLPYLPVDLMMATGLAIGGGGGGGSMVLG